MVPHVQSDNNYYRDTIAGKKGFKSTQKLRFQAVHSIFTQHAETMKVRLPTQSRLNVLGGPGPAMADGAPIIPMAHVEGWVP